MMDLHKKRCTNCGRFPFCEYQMYCNPEIKKYDHWIKREVTATNVKSKNI